MKVKKGRTYLVYGHFRGFDGVVEEDWSNLCYVGISCQDESKRALKMDKHNRSDLYVKSVKKYGATAKILASNLTYVEAAMTEMFIIAGFRLNRRRYKEVGDIGWNLTDGGEGDSGAKRTKEMKLNQSNIVNQKILDGTWHACGPRKDINYLLNIAKKRGVKLLSKKYVKAKALYKWKCPCGNSFKRIAYDLERGTWALCEKCMSIERAKLYKKTPQKTSVSIIDANGVTYISKSAAARAHNTSVTSVTRHCDCGSFQKGEWVPVRKPQFEYVA
jgi:hypothetical protein